MKLEGQTQFRELLNFNRAKCCQCAAEQFFNLTLRKMFNLYIGHRLIIPNTGKGWLKEKLYKG